VLERGSRSTLVEALGFEAYATGARPGAAWWSRLGAGHQPKKGERLPVRVSTYHLFDRATGRSLAAEPDRERGPA
jgi:hypothetical protein